jgi:hypothetical protein
MTGEQAAGWSIRDSSCLTSLGERMYSIYFFSFTPMIVPLAIQRHSAQPKLASRPTISLGLQGTIPSRHLFHTLELHRAMRRQRPPAEQCNQHKRTNSLRCKLIDSLRLLVKYPPKPPHDRAMCRHPTRLSTRQERIKARDEWRDPEIHRGPPSREELRRGPKGVAER